MSPVNARRAECGMTLLELLIVGSIVTVAATAMLEFFATQTDLLDTSAALNQLRTQAQLAIDAILKELRHGTRATGGSPPNVSIPAAPNNTSMTFYLPIDRDGNGLITDAAGNIEWDTLNPIRYPYVAASRQLQRVAGAATRVLANDVTSVTFEDRNIDPTLYTDEVRVRLTLQRTTPRGRTVTVPASAMVKLRN